MKLLRLITISGLLLAIPSCGNTTFSGGIATPYGTIVAEGKGNFAVELKPIIVTK